MADNPSGVQTPVQPASGANPVAQPTPPAQGGKDDGLIPRHVMHEERAARQAAEAKVKDLETRVNELSNAIKQQQLKPQAPTPQWQPPPAQPNPQDYLESLYEQDYRKGMQAEMKMAFQWMSQTLTNESLQYDDAKAKYNDFGRYETQIKQYMANLPIDQRGTPGMIESAYFMLRGKDFDNALKQREDELAQRYRSQGVNIGSGTISSGNTGGGDIKVTQQEIDAAKVMNIPIEEYVKHRKVM